MGPFKVIGSFSHEQRWAHSRLSAVFIWTTMGQFKVIGSDSHEQQQWAHSRLSAVFIMDNNGPIQGYRQ
jgi:hypothetical protein